MTVNFWSLLNGLYSTYIVQVFRSGLNYNWKFSQYDVIIYYFYILLPFKY